VSQPTTDGGPERVNVAFTQAVEPVARRLQARLRMPTLMDVARIAIAFAVRQDLPLDRPSNFGPASKANYNVGSLDPGRDLRGLVLALHPELTDDPYRVIETLMNVGTLELDRQVNAGTIISLQDLVASS
jgi:hypothetical protein